MKFPGRIRITHIWFDVSYVKLKKSATYDIDKGIIKIKKNTTSDDILDSLLHECIEIYFILKGYSYAGRGATYFTFKHEDLYKITSDLVLMLEQIYK